jgi:hypothetical protein
VIAGTILAVTLLRPQGAVAEESEAGLEPAYSKEAA